MQEAGSELKSDLQTDISAPAVGGIEMRPSIAAFLATMPLPLGAQAVDLSKGQTVSARVVDVTDGDTIKVIVDGTPVEYRSDEYLTDDWGPKWMEPVGVISLPLGALGFLASATVGGGNTFEGTITAGSLKPLFFVGLPLGCPLACDLEQRRRTMPGLRSLLLAFLIVGVVHAADEKTRRELVKQRAIERAYQKRIAKEWQVFSQRFVIRRTIPVYSGAYQIGWQTEVIPNYAAIREYQMQLERLKWESMTEQERRDYALFVIAHNTGVIAENLERIARDGERISFGVQRMAEELNDVERAVRDANARQLINQLWPMP